MKTTTRIRGRALQALRTRLLSDNPLCVVCQGNGITTPATELDHIKALGHGGTNDVDNLQGLCRNCHDDKTRADMGQTQRAKFDTLGRVIW